MRKWLWDHHQKWVSSGGTEGQSSFVYICLSPQGSAVIRVFSFIKILVVLCVQTLVQAHQAVVSQALLFVLCTSCYGSNFHDRLGDCSGVLVWCRVVGSWYDP